MIPKPVAILRFRWKDQVRAVPKWPNSAYTGCFLPIRPMGVARYWQAATFGLLDLSGSVVYPWLVLDIDMPKDPLGRSTVLAKAIEQGLDEGFPLHQFGGVAAMVIPNTPGIDSTGKPYMPIDGGAIGIETRGGWWMAALLSEDGEQDFFAHELGHVLGFDHSWGREYGFPTEYADPYCVMGAQDYAWVATPDPGLAVHAGYWERMAPRPAGATLYQYLPEFTSEGFAVDLGSNFQSVPRSVRLHAFDLGRKPNVAVVTVPGTQTRYTVEYRRQSGWDKQVIPAVVVHSVMPSFIPTQPIRATYEGRILVPPKGDLDWQSANKQVTVLFDGVEDDGSAVDVAIGGMALVSPRGAAIDFFEGGYSNLYEEGVAEVFVPPVCGRQAFKFYIDQQETTVWCTAESTGFEKPVFSWKINGVSIPQVGSFFIDPNRVSVPVVAKFPRPDSETTESRNADLTFTITGNVLELHGDSSDGNYQVQVEVIVSEGDEDADLGQTASISGTAKMTGILVSYEQAYYDAVQACVQMLQGYVIQYPNFKVPRPGDPVSRTMAKVIRWQSALNENNPVLAEQLGQVTRVLHDLVTLQAVRMRRRSAAE